jgi:hypothetical protein
VKAAWLLLIPIAASLLGVWGVLRTERRAMELVEQTHVPMEGEDA